MSRYSVHSRRIRNPSGEESVGQEVHRVAEPRKNVPGANSRRHLSRIPSGNATVPLAGTCFRGSLNLRMCALQLAVQLVECAQIGFGGSHDDIGVCTAAIHDPS